MKLETLSFQCEGQTLESMALKGCNLASLIILTLTPKSSADGRWTIARYYVNMKLLEKWAPDV
jgi:hypothetical protein